MKCKNCGTEFQEGIFCPECGTRISEYISTLVPEQSINADLVKERLAKEREEYEAEIERQKTEQVRLEKERIELEFNRQKLELEQARQAEELRVRQEGEDGQIKEATDKHKAEKKSRIMAVLSLIFGILALITMGVLVIPEILGIIFAYKSKDQGKMRGAAKAGLICSIIPIILLLIPIIAVIIILTGILIGVMFE